MSAPDPADLVRALIRMTVVLGRASVRLGIPEDQAVADAAGPQSDDAIAALLAAVRNQARREASAALARVDQLVADVDERYRQVAADPAMAAHLRGAPIVLELEELRRAVDGTSS